MMSFLQLTDQYNTNIQMDTNDTINTNDGNGCFIRCIGMH